MKLQLTWLKIDFNRKIVELFTTEEIFKLITNPMFFPTQKKDFQRTMLFRMAGDVTNDEMVELHPEFSCLVGELTGKTLDYDLHEFEHLREHKPLPVTKGKESQDETQRS